jgi:hypothetical protein
LCQAVLSVSTIVDTNEILLTVIIITTTTSALTLSLQQYHRPDAWSKAE